MNRGETWGTPAVAATARSTSGYIRDVRLDLEGEVLSVAWTETSTSSNGPSVHRLRRFRLDAGGGNTLTPVTHVVDLLATENIPGRSQVALVRSGPDREMRLRTLYYLARNAS